jgi:hypothetical protein
LIGPLQKMLDYPTSLSCSSVKDYVIGLLIFNIDLIICYSIQIHENIISSSNVLDLQTAYS